MSCHHVMMSQLFGDVITWWYQEIQWKRAKLTKIQWKLSKNLSILHKNLLFPTELSNYLPKKQLLLKKPTIGKKISVMQDRRTFWSVGPMPRRRGTTELPVNELILPYFELLWRHNDVIHPKKYFFRKMHSLSFNLSTNSGTFRWKKIWPP